MLAHSTHHDLAGREISSPVFPLVFLGSLIVGLLIFCGFLFWTYTISMPVQSMEMVRQLGLPFIVAELAFILWAATRGFRLDAFWRGLAPYLKWSVLLFLGTFWIGSAFYSEVRPLAVLHNIFMLIQLVFACALAFAVGRFDYEDIHKMATALAAGLLLFCGMTAYAFTFHPPLSSMPNNEIIWQYAVPGFISLRLFGAFCGALFCFLLGVCILADERKKLNFWHIAWMILAAAMVIWSGTRAAVLGAIVATAMAMVFFRVRPSLKAVAAFCIAIAIATAIALALVPKGDILFLLYTSGDVATGDAATGGRLEYWTSVWNAYLHYPIFGAGPYATGFLLDGGDVVHVQPHNIVLQFLITWGAIATFFALVIMAIATWKVHRIAARHRIILPFLMMLDCLLLMSLLDGMTHFAQPLMLIMISYAAIFGYSHAAERGDPQTQAA
jgi:exopolysaccharide production protein ExoQ